MRKKIISMIAAFVMVASVGATSAFAANYNTKVDYSASANGIVLDIKGDGTQKITLTDTVTYGISVPAQVTVNGAGSTAYIAGYTNAPVTLSVSNAVTMTDTKNNTLTANFAMGTNNSLKLNISLTAISRVSALVSSTWAKGSTPQIGTWTGIATYTVA